MQQWFIVKFKGRDNPVHMRTTYQWIINNRIQNIEWLDISTRKDREDYKRNQNESQAQY